MACCAVMARQMTTRALGVGGVWRSGWFMYDRGRRWDLGPQDKDQIVGFLTVAPRNASFCRSLCSVALTGAASPCE
jgi:hypothetical protein